MSATFTVIGTTKIHDIILRTGTLDFKPGSKLVISPPKDSPDAPRTLTIIAQKINISTGIGEITYDSDGDDQIDADTPAANWPNPASNGASGNSITGEGSYPLATDGDDGKPGGQGATGKFGISAPSMEIWANEIRGEGKIKINFKGQDGAKGQTGGNGGPGGTGQKGAKSMTSDSWYNGDQCDRESGQGGRGGDGGDAGYPGTGGDGGKGGLVQVFVPHDFVATAKAWTFIVSGGKGGVPGNQGNVRRPWNGRSTRRRYLTMQRQRRL